MSSLRDKTNEAHMGVPADFDGAVQTYSAEIFAYLWRLTGDNGDAQDCLQEAFLRAYRAYGRLPRDANVRAWLYRIASNTAFTHLKRRNREQARASALDPARAASAGGPGDALIRREALQAVAAEVERLPQQQKAALILRKYQELSYAEIAATLGTTQAAARANVYQAVKRLRANLNGLEW
jgi:RNA polymerase sigma-70 factor (ECF subfamily)